MKTNQIVQHLKDENMDSEFYPTTDDIIQAIKPHLSGRKILDIGAGNGATLEKLTSGENQQRWTRYAIEKNPMLKSLINSNILIIGDDFYENSLWDKKLDVIFCNPPYSEYDDWCYKIISEANAKQIFFVIPDRWSQVEKIQYIIKERGFIVTSLGKFNFINAERAARCNVEVLYLQEERSFRMRDYFDIELERFFDFNSNTQNTTRTDAKQHFAEQIEAHKIICGGDYVKSILSLYDEEQQRINNTIQGLSAIDVNLLKELDIEIRKIKSLIVEKLETLNSKYWMELISRLQPIAKRLTTKNQKDLFNAVTDARMSFNAANIHNVVAWAVKTASQQMETQIIDVYDSLLKNINCTEYKSNHRVFVENQFEAKIPQKLNLRIVVNKWRGIQPDSWNTYEYPQRLHNDCHEFFSDLFVIANNLGFAIDSNSSHLVEWHAGEKQDFYAVKNGKKIMLMSVKVYLNDNIHLKLNKEFNHQINVIKGKHEGWIHSINDVIEEFEVSEKEAEKLFEGMPQVTYNIAGLLN